MSHDDFSGSNQLTTSAGNPIADNQNSLTAGPRGPLLLQDYQNGAMQFFDNNIQKPDAYYEPNSFNGAKENKRYAEPALPLHGDTNCYDHRDGNDDYTQAGTLFRLFDAGQRQRLFENIAAAMQGVPDEIKRRQIALFAKCDSAYGAGMAKAVELDTGIH